MEDKFLEVAKKAALEAGEIISKYYGSDLRKNLKNADKSDFTTKADLEAEEKIVEILKENFPDHNIIAEEKHKIDKGSIYTWMIDPLDGSLTFDAGIPFFAVSIGLLKDNKPVLGVIYQIPFKEFYIAEEGKGAYLNGKRIYVSKKKDLAESLMVLDPGHSKRRPGKMESYILPLMNKIAYPYSFGSGVSTQGMVAKGVLDGLVSQAWRWDFTAGVVIVREAGGKVTDFEGKELDWTKDRIDLVASNGLIHDAILEVLKK